MVRRCSVVGCGGSVGLHSFPLDLEIRQNSQLPPGAVVCNQHFTRDSLELTASVCLVTQGP
uniref:Uncharacterized protein n=1 Tax=Nothobranchius furzeri TaxID=105023 RepID=A0A8C6K7Q5_NOTFU